MRNRIAAALLSILSATLIAIGPAKAQEGRRPDLPEIPVDAYTLPNGLKVVLSRDSTVPRVTVCLAYHVGSKNERAGRTGFAHFFEHMMFRGTENVPDYDIPLQEAGSFTNAFTTEDMTVYFETVPANYLERALYMEAERLAFLPSALDQEKFDTEREIVKNERRQNYENVPYGLADETILANLFPEGHPYSWSVIGSMADLDRSTLDDLKEFFAEFYHPANATLCLVGDFDPEQAKAWIETYFGTLRPGKTPRRPEAPPAPPVDARLVQADQVQFPRVHWAWPTVAEDHPDTPALDLLAAILADGEASRLYRALVRDTRVASDVSASSDTREVAGLFLIEATADEGKAVEEVEAALSAELEKIREAEPSDDELRRALAKYESALYTSPFMGLVSPLGRAIVLSTGFAQKDDPRYFLRSLEKLFEVTPADVRRVARDYLTPEKLSLVIRPAEPGEPESPAVQAGPKPIDEPAPAIESAALAPAPGGPDWTRMPGPSDPVDFQGPGFVRKSLENGLDVWVAPWRTLPIAGVALLLPSGTAADPEGKAGLATLTASLLDKGTEARTAQELAEAFESLGIQLSVGAGIDTTTVRFNSLSRNLEPALDLLGEMLTSPRLDPEDFERERQLQLTGLIQGPDSPRWIAQRAFRSLLYGRDHPYGGPPDGDVETVRELSIEEVRGFVDRHVTPAGSTLVIVGDVDPEAIFKSLEDALAGWDREGSPASAVEAPDRARGTGVVYLVDKPGAEQSLLSVGRLWRGRDDPQYFANLLGNRIFGGDFLSRLNQNLRVRNGYSYGANSFFSYRRSGSVWAVSTAVRTDATAEALREIFNELEGLAEGSNPFAAEDVLVARDAEVRSFPETFESPGGIAAALAEMAQYDLPEDYLDTYLDRLRATSDEAVNQALAEVVPPDEMVTLIVGDRATIEPELDRLGFQDVRVINEDGRPVDDN